MYQAETPARAAFEMRDAGSIRLILVNQEMIAYLSPSLSP